MKKREKWIDIARGILIFFVVLGHSTLGANHGDKNSFCYYIYLFHFLFYAISHIHSKYFGKVAFPFAIDVSFIALAYYAFGYYFKQYIINKYIFLSSAILSMFFIIAIRLNIIDYGLEMWAHNYKNFILDFVVPIVISIFIFNFSKYLEDVWGSNFIAEIGKYTLPIMAMHIAISRGIIKTIIGRDYNFFIFTILGVMIPYFIAKYILQKSKILKLLFGI
ncbi:hypothetical protein [Clostridium sp.]|uniref:hypothetical protein n=1 Tax=Clostridium sp. TaxID=1506 RepID=UPI0029111CF6|nr:hypothetical protein [Clostridium sp.]MDU4478623.1 hypothetical protein [Clostridium sp.]